MITICASKLNMSPFILLIFLFVGLTLAQDKVAKDGPEIAVRAPSTFVNCDCQCDRHAFRHRGRNTGNCLSADQTGANFCFIDRRSVRACRDTQATDPSVFGFQSRGRFISYEACTTPPRRECREGNVGGQNNFGDGDFNKGLGNGRLTFQLGGFQGNQNGGFNLGSLLGLSGGADNRPSLASLLGTRSALPEETGQ